MAARLQALVALGAWLLMRPALGSAAQGVHVDTVSSQVYLDHMRTDQTSVSLRGKSQVVDSKGLAMRSLAIGAGFTALLEAPMIWDKLSSVLGWRPSSPLELSSMPEGGAASDDGHYPEGVEETWKIKGDFAVICFCTFVLALMRRSFQRSAKPTMASRADDTCVQTPRVEPAKRQRSVTVVSPNITPRTTPRRTTSESSGADEQTCHGWCEDSNDPTEMLFHKIYTPGASRACSKESTATFENEIETQFHKINTPGSSLTASQFHNMCTPGSSRASSKNSVRAAAQSSSYGWEAD